MLQVGVVACLMAEVDWGFHRRRCCISFFLLNMRMEKAAGATGGCAGLVMAGAGLVMAGAALVMAGAAPTPQPFLTTHNPHHS